MSSRKEAVAKAATISDVARQVGVTKMTVSNVLNGKSQKSAYRETILRAAQELDYQPNPHAQRLANGRCHNTISLLSLMLDMGVGTSKIQMIQGLLHERGYSAPIHAYGLIAENTLADRSSLLGELRLQKPRAIVCYASGMRPDALDELRRYQDEGGLVVSHGKPLSLSCDQVVVDDENHGYQAARHLLELGHRELGLFTIVPREWSETFVSGFRRALNEFGGVTRDEWLLFGPHTKFFPREQRGLEMARYFLALQDRPSGLCMVNDYAALAFIGEVARAGIRVPDDVSIVGQDNVPLAGCGLLPLTTVSHPSEAVSQRVVEFLCDRLDGRYNGEPRFISLHGELIERQSSAGPAGVEAHHLLNPA
jgi:DNA-binding LacI/PurR family transcriptional regulator